MAGVTFEGVGKVYPDGTRAVSGMDLTINDGEFMVLLGPSGCGKTTLLRSIAGLEQIDGGRIVIGDRDVTDLPPRKRNIAMVFQSYAVFPHMTVFENIAFGLRMHKSSKADVQKQVRESAELLHIENLLDRYPAQTSGGQRQRIAVARLRGGGFPRGRGRRPRGRLQLPGRPARGLLGPVGGHRPRPRQGRVRLPTSGLAPRTARGRGCPSLRSPARRRDHPVNFH